MKYNEVFSFGDFPEKNIDYNKLSNSLLNNPDNIIQVHEKLFIYITNDYHALVKNNNILGFIKLTNSFIKDKEYNNIDLIYIIPNYRNTSALYKLIYYVKEFINKPILADGAIFTGGQNLINKFLSNNLARVSVINKKTGEKKPFTNFINDPNYSYMFESTFLGFGKQYLPESFTWFPLFKI